MHEDVDDHVLKATLIASHGEKMSAREGQRLYQQCYVSLSPGTILDENIPCIFIANLPKEDQSELVEGRLYAPDQLVYVDPARIIDMPDMPGHGSLQQLAMKLQPLRTLRSASLCSKPTVDANRVACWHAGCTPIQASTDGTLQQTSKTNSALLARQVFYRQGASVVNC